jgi:hypothetical protein
MARDEAPPGRDRAGAWTVFRARGINMLNRPLTLPLKFELRINGIFHLSRVA